MQMVFSEKDIPEPFHLYLAFAYKYVTALWGARGVTTTTQRKQKKTQETHSTIKPCSKEKLDPFPLGI
jgi:hypothetical protein